MHELSQRTRIAYATVHAWKQGKSEPESKSLHAISRVLGFDVVTLLAPAVGVPMIREHAEWATALEEAKERYARKLPDWALDRAGDTRYPHAPAHIDGTFVFRLAQLWWEFSSDEELSREATDAARREIEHAQSQVPDRSGKKGERSKG